MSASNFPAVMAEIFKHEGGYVDHPADPGGATNMGITFAMLQMWRGKHITKADVQALTKAEAEAIYRANYWNPTKCDDLPAGIDLIMMDGSVNSGIGRGPKWVQAALGVTVDGKVGPATIAAAKAADPVTVINAACDARLKFLRGLKTWPTFGKGWQRRVDEVRAVALKMAKAAPPKPVEPKTDPEPPRTPPGETKAWGLATALGAVILFLAAIITKGFGLV